MKKIIFYSATEYYDFLEKFHAGIVYKGYNCKEIYVVVRDYLIKHLIDKEGFEDIDFKPVFVEKFSIVEEIKERVGNPKSFYVRYFRMKKQYLIEC